MAAMIDRPSPNHGPRPANATIDMLVLHYTGMPDAASALERMCDPASEVSAHYMIDEDGRVTRLVAEDRRAWHAGLACWAGASDINDRSIGIELVNPGHEFGYRPFPEAQMAALEELARNIVGRHAIPPARVLGHSDVAPGRKQDPGELFDWARLARAGVGFWPQIDAISGLGEHLLPAGADDPLVAEARDLLARYGYETGPGATLDPLTARVLTAFQRHFRPFRVDGRLDRQTMEILRVLAASAG
jgi:N-acetylmuramoyl-L-alanine amidase